MAMGVAQIAAFSAAWGQGNLSISWIVFILLTLLEGGPQSQFFAEMRKFAGAIALQW